jgi:hypothetical protein
MRSKCYGALQCAAHSASVAFNFQILPVDDSLASVPLTKCSSSGTYVPEASDISLVRAILLSDKAIGTWSLRVSTGSEPQTIVNASFYFKTVTLDFRIGSTSVTSLAWFADSSASMSAPGFLLGPQAQESSSGWGRNQSILALASGVASPSSILYSYPDPVLCNVSAASSFLSSGSSRLHLAGSFFSNANPPSIRARAGLSSCRSTVWLSDTSLACMLPPSLGSSRAFAVSLDRSAVARVSSLIVHLPTAAADSKPAAATTASSLVTLGVVGFGLWDSSGGVRVVVRMSSAHALMWLSDTKMAGKITPSTRNRLGVVISLAGASNELSSAAVPEKLMQITACNSSSPGMLTGPDKLSVASSGSNSVAVVGIGFAFASDNSIRVRFSRTGAQCSAWVSDSMVASKSPWGFRSANPELIFSMDVRRENSSSVFNFRASDARNLSIFNESATAMVLDGSAFSPFQLQALLKIDDRAVVTNWTSDSSISCVYPWPVSRDVVNFFVRVFDPSNPSLLLSTSAPANPIFLAWSKPIADSLNIALYIPAPADVANNAGNFIQRGAATGWTFPSQQFSSPPPSFFESELIDADIAVYNNHTQVYLKDYAPVGVDVYGAVLLYDSAGNTLSSDLVCGGNSSLIISTSLLRSTFATLYRTTFALCSLPTTVASMTLSVVATVQLRDERGLWISFSTLPVLVTVKARTQAAFVGRFTNANFSAGAVSTGSAIVSLGNAGAACSRLVFDYTANVSCLSNNPIFVPVIFFPDGLCSDGRGALTIRNKVQRTCDIDLQGWTFGLAGSCRITIEALLFGVSLTVPISVKAGEPNEMFVIGQLPSRVAAGGIIWSNNASLMKCLELGFTDRCNNTRSNGGFTCKLSAFLSNTSQYALLGETIVDAGANGRCIWFSARMSLFAPFLVKLQVQWLQLQRYLQPLVNVSGLGEAAVVSLITPTLTNSTKAGNVLTPVTFKLFDANGVPVSGGGTVIRVRIVQRQVATAAR